MCCYYFTFSFSFPISQWLLNKLVFFIKQLPIFLIFYSCTTFISLFFLHGFSKHDCVSFSITPSFDILNFADYFTELLILEFVLCWFLWCLTEFKHWSSICVLFIFCWIHELLFFIFSVCDKPHPNFIPFICNQLLSALKRSILYTLFPFLIPTYCSYRYVSNAIKISFDSLTCNNLRMNFLD